jgi:flagellar biosynthetic protein FliQ
MTPEMVIDIGRETLYVTLMVAAPMLLFGLVVGILIGIFQAVTQINEMTLVFVPKILAVTIAVVIFLPWMLRVIVAFATKLITRVGTL